MKDDLDRLIDELAEERPRLRERVEAAIATRLARAHDAVRQHAQAAHAATRGQGLSVRDAAALLGITPAGLKLHDARLQPVRDSSGRRTYDRTSVLALARERSKAARSRLRRAS